jgi:hypothetical protein
VITTLRALQGQQSLSDCENDEVRTVMKPTLRNLIVIFVILQGILTASVLYIAWRVKDIYDAIPGEPITVTIEPKKQ